MKAAHDGGSAPKPPLRAASTLVHLGVLAISVVGAVGVWTREKEPKALASGDVVVWSGRSGDVEKVGYESKAKKVAVEAKKDDVGRYFIGTVDKESAPPSPHGTDAGAPPPALAARTTVSFVSVGPGDKMAEQLAPLKALRALGKIGDDRAAEFGLADPEATVTAKISGTERKLLIGGTTPGGGDRYVRDGASGEVYVIKGEPIRTLEAADSLLMERDLHEWKDSEVQKAKVEAGGKSRELLRSGPESKRFWADAASADTNDETLGNWMSKIERLRPSEFSLTPPEGQAAVVRVEYTGRKALGYLELVKVAGDKPTYYVRTERTRLFGKVANAVAEQVETDLGTIVK